MKGRDERVEVSLHGKAGGVLPKKRLMGMCRWMGSHFHDYWVAFSIEVLEWGRTLSVFLG